MVYVDPSARPAFFLHEAKTADAWCWFNREPPGSIAVRDWTLTEPASAMVIRDLLGPAGGPEEEQDEHEDDLSSRYLVGSLAPAHVARS
jgi:hypothetical protein